MANSVTLDFTDVKDGSNIRPGRVEEGDYAAKIVSVEVGKSGAGNQQAIFTIKLDSHRGNAYAYYCGFNANVLWKLRTLAIAAGIPVPKKRVKFDLDRLVGKSIAVSMIDDEFEGKEKSTIDNVFPLDELDGETVDPDEADEDDELEEDDDEEEEVASPKKRSRKAPEPEPEEDDEEDEDDEEEEEPVKPARKRRAKAKPVEDDDDEIDLDDI